MSERGDGWGAHLYKAGEEERKQAREDLDGIVVVYL